MFYGSDEANLKKKAKAATAAAAKKNTLIHRTQIMFVITNEVNNELVR